MDPVAAGPVPAMCSVTDPNFTNIARVVQCDIPVAAGPVPAMLPVTDPNVANVVQYRLHVPSEAFASTRPAPTVQAQHR